MLYFRYSQIEMFVLRLSNIKILFTTLEWVPFWVQT